MTVFVFLAAVTARGGGTVVLSGSHRLFHGHIASTGIWRPADVKAALASRHPRLRASWSEDRHTAFHVAAPNTLAAPRMMLVEIVDRVGQAGATR